MAQPNLSLIQVNYWKCKLNANCPVTSFCLRGSSVTGSRSFVFTSITSAAVIPLFPVTEGKIPAWVTLSFQTSTVFKETEIKYRDSHASLRILETSIPYPISTLHSKKHSTPTPLLLCRSFI